MLWGANSSAEEESQMTSLAGFRWHELDETHGVYVGALPPEIRVGHFGFRELWDQRPAQFPEVMIHGKLVKTPRWQQAYGRDYHFTGRTSAALPIVPELEPFLAYGHSRIDARLNGLLLNWYDATLSHRIGKHRDSVKQMVVGAPMVTISLGAMRTFRVRPWRGTGWTDFTVADGDVIVMPYRTNLEYTHEVPHFKQNIGQRISVTIRAFE
jgi:alkylated DNA repair dioxygenase AlkB